LPWENPQSCRKFQVTLKDPGYPEGLRKLTTAHASQFHPVVDQQPCFANIERLWHRFRSSAAWGILRQPRSTKLQGFQSLRKIQVVVRSRPNPLFVCWLVGLFAFLNGFLHLPSWDSNNNPAGPVPMGQCPTCPHRDCRLSLASARDWKRHSEKFGRPRSSPSKTFSFRQFARDCSLLTGCSMGWWW